MRITLSVAKVIALLEAKLVELKNWPKIEAEHDEKHAIWERRLADFAFVHGKVDTARKYGDNAIAITITLPEKAANKLPKEPVKPERPKGAEYGSIDRATQEVENALKFLRMTEKTEVSMSALKDVSNYI